MPEDGEVLIHSRSRGGGSHGLSGRNQLYWRVYKSVACLEVHHYLGIRLFGLESLRDRELSVL